VKFIDPLIEKYCIENTSQEESLLKEIYRETNHKVLMPRMISGHYLGSFLKMISSLKKPKKILEVGTYTGYSAICLSHGLAQNGEIHSIDINEEISDFTKKFISKSINKEKIHLHIGDAKNIIPKLKHKFDLIFIDADKKNYCLYFDMCIDKLNPNGFILIDNVLWSGKVLNKSKDSDLETNEIKKLNKKILNDPRVENILLPIRDGLMICKLL
tara:strand:+ start:1027 stop:1668 length:642 start_codon:yes stop_codon:yes gene_type:complete